mgnify:CR=1 FL=1
MQLEEGLAEAGGEGRGGLGDAALGAGQLRGEAGQEVVLGLLRGQDGDGRQNAERVGGQEDDVLGVRCGRDRADDLLNVVDGVGDTLIVVVPISSPSVFILIPQQLVEPGSRRSMMSFWIAGLRSRKLTKVPWIRMIYTPLGAYFFGSASTFRSVSAVVTFT